jgi:hypothetical protein
MDLALSTAILAVLVVAPGRTHRIRFMPTAPGQYTFSVTYSVGGALVVHDGDWALLLERTD